MLLFWLFDMCFCVCSNYLFPLCFCWSGFTRVSRFTYSCLSFVRLSRFCHYWFNFCQALTTFSILVQLLSVSHDFIVLGLTFVGPSWLFRSWINFHRALTALPFFVILLSGFQDFVVLGLTLRVLCGPCMSNICVIVLTISFLFWQIKFVR